MKELVFSNWPELTDSIKRMEAAKEITLINDRQMQKDIFSVARKESVVQWNRENNDHIFNLSETPYGMGYGYFNKLLNDVRLLFRDKNYIIHFE